MSTRLSTTIQLTDEQREAILPLIHALWDNPGASVVAQVWHDGARVAVINKQESEAFAIALGGYKTDTPVGSLSESIAQKITQH